MSKAAQARTETGENEEGLEPLQFPPIGSDVDENGEIITQEDEPAEELDPVEARIRGLEEKYEADRAQWAERERRQQDMIDRLMTSQSAASTAEPAAPEPVSWDDLPDPVEKPEEFKKAVAQKTQAAIKAATASAPTGQDPNQDVTQVWESFKTEYEDLAKHEMTAQGATAAIAAEYRARGIDPRRAIMLNPEGFKSQLAERMRTELGLEKGPDPDTTTNRTGGVAGGSRTRKSGQQKAPAKSFMDALRDKQLNEGLL